MPDLAAMYLLGLASGIAIGAIGTFVVLMHREDGWQDIAKGGTRLQRMKDAGIGVAKKKDPNGPVQV